MNSLEFSKKFEEKLVERMMGQKPIDAMKRFIDSLDIDIKPLKLLEPPFIFGINHTLKFSRMYNTFFYEFSHIWITTNDAIKCNNVSGLNICS